MYQALYRKYRPQTFSDIVGQEHVTVTLKRQIMSDRQSHAYLFVGTRGTGKTSCAKVLARAINCENPIGGDPCNKCASCTGIENGTILDVLELDAASNNGVDDVRALRDEAIYSPAVTRKRVYIIDEVHMLTNPAFNALLKILEEPPEHLVFILATTALHRIPATILSRCQRFSFRRLSIAAMSSQLHSIASNEGYSLTDEAAGEISALADGSMRDALSLLDQCASDTLIDLQHVLNTFGLVGHQEVFSLIKAVATGNAFTAIETLDRLYSDGRDMSSLLSRLASLVRDVLVHKLTSASPLLSGSFPDSELSDISASLSPEQLNYYLEIIREATYSLSRNANTMGASTKLTVEMALFRMCNEHLSDHSTALLSRISKLESSIINQESRVHIEKYENAEPKAVLCIDEITTIDIKDDLWNNILEQLRHDMSIHALLSDNDRVKAEINSNDIVIRSTDPFTVSLIESTKYLNPLKDAANKVMGHNISIQVVADSDKTEDAKQNKIDDLSKFDVVKFEE